MSGHGEPKLNEQEAPLKRCTRFNQKAGLPITAKGATFKGEIGAGEKTQLLSIHLMLNTLESLALTTILSNHRIQV